MTAYDLTELRALGRKRQRLMEQLEELRPEIEREIYQAAHAVPPVPQVDIIKITGCSRETVRLASMSDEERQAERDKRRNKTKA